VLKTFLDQLIEADRVHEERAENAVNHLVRDACIRQGQAVYPIPRDRVLVLRLKDHTWNVQVLCVLERFVDPSFQHLRVHLDAVVSVGGMSHAFRRGVFRLN
jgi:hypothetical protein